MGGINSRQLFRLSWRFMIAKSRTTRRRAGDFHHVRVTRETRTRAVQTAPPVDPVNRQELTAPIHDRQ